MNVACGNVEVMVGSLLKTFRVDVVRHLLPVTNIFYFCTCFMPVMRKRIFLFSSSIVGCTKIRFGIPIAPTMVCELQIGCNHVEMALKEVYDELSHFVMSGLQIFQPQYQ